MIRDFFVGLLFSMAQEPHHVHKRTSFGVRAHRLVPYFEPVFDIKQPNIKFPDGTLHLAF